MLSWRFDCYLLFGHGELVIWLEDEALEEGGCICIDVHCGLIMAFPVPGR